MKNKTLIGLLSIISLVGCDIGPGDKAPIHETELFQYIYLKENGTRHKNLKTNEIVIVGFTEIGKQQTSLDIPLEINGNPVTMLGIEDQSYSYNHNWIVEPSETLQYLYIHENIKFINFKGGNASLFICAESHHIKYGYYSFKEMFCPSVWFEDETEMSRGQFNIANTTFFLNQSSGVEIDSVYRIENYSNDEVIKRPIDPTIDGYIFVGWYTEKECINSWDFNTTVNFEDLHVFNLYAGWQRI